MFNICSRIVLHKEKHFFFYLHTMYDITTRLAGCDVDPGRTLRCGGFRASHVASRKDLKKRFCADVYVIFINDLLTSVCKLNLKNYQEDILKLCGVCVCETVCMHAQSHTHACMCACMCVS